jgi:membrane protease YdiL (CAAX protease family)
VSALFGLAHMQWNVAIDVFVLSMVACYLRELTGSIWAGIILHCLKNLIAFIALFFVSTMR